MEHEGLLAVPVTEPDRRVALYYRPASFMVGALISGLTALGLVAYSVSRALGWHSQEARRRSRRGEVGERSSPSSIE